MGNLPNININNVAFLTKDVTLNEIQTLLDIAKRHGVHFWNDAVDFAKWSDGEEEHVAYFSAQHGIDGCDGGLTPDQQLVSYAAFLLLFLEHYGEVVKNLDEVPVRNPRPRYRKRSRQKPTVAKTIVRVLYTTQQVYTFKNVRSVQIIDDKVYIQHERDITEGIKESSESEINGDLVMAVVIHEVGNRSNFFRNIDGTWDFQAEDGTVINSGKQLGRVFKK